METGGKGMHHYESNTGVHSAFNFGNINRFFKIFPYFRQPVILGDFSVDGNLDFINDDSYMKYLVHFKPGESINFNLNIGYEKVINKKDESDKKINHILNWIIQNKEKIPQVLHESFSLSADIVCFRGLLTLMFCSPYERRDGWIICATKFMGTIYLCLFETEESKMRNASLTERDRLLCSYGYKFEQYMSSVQPGCKPITNQPVNENEGYALMFRSRLNSHSLMYGGEVDCIDLESDSERNPIVKTPKMFVELKTSRVITNYRQDANFKRFKLLKWWAQSFMAGIPRITCGFRDDDGIVQHIKDFKTLSIPKLTEECWDASICTNCADEILHFIKDNVKEDNPESVYKFELNPGKYISCEKLSGSDRIIHQILPEWYIKWRKDQ